MKNNKLTSPQKYFNIKNIAFLLFLLFTLSCKKLVDINQPVTQLTGIKVYTNNASAIAVVTGIYDRMIVYQGLSSGSSSFGSLCGLSADELDNFTTIIDWSQFYQNAIIPDNSNINTRWGELYQYIYSANDVIAELASATAVSAPVKKQLTGEAEFIRAFCYFYLVNLWGDVPLITTTAYQTNAKSSRTDKTLVFQQIINDLNDAKSKLNSNYVGGDVLTTTTERVRPTKWAAMALLGRVYLYTGAWANAKLSADSVINNGGTYSLVSDLNSVFLKNSTEAIWQLQSVFPGLNTYDGYTYILTSGPNDYANPVALSKSLLSSFELGDNRRTNWINADSSTGTKYYYPFKYKIGVMGQPVTEYTMVLRLAEQYLIRAEAEANGATGGTSAALNDLNAIRNRAGLPNYSGPTNQVSLLATILHERQVELFTEWGHRWMDLKRTGKVDSVMSVITPLKNGVWNTNKQLYPIPVSETSSDPNITQNTGY